MSRRKTSSPFTLQDLGRFFNVLKDETDRAALVLGVAMIHEHLKAVLLKALGPHLPHKSGAEDPFVRGPQPLLESLSTCIHLAHRLHIIGPEAYREMHRLREMRNDCAHSWMAVDLMASPFREHIEHLAAGLGDSWKSFKDVSLPHLGATTRESLKLRLSITLFAASLWQMSTIGLAISFPIKGGERGFLGR